MQLHVWALLPDKKSSRWLLKHTIYSTDYTMEQVADSLKSFAIFNVLVFLIFFKFFLFVPAELQVTTWTICR